MPSGHGKLPFLGVHTRSRREPVGGDVLAVPDGPRIDSTGLRLCLDVDVTAVQRPVDTRLAGELGRFRRRRSPRPGGMHEAREIMIQWKRRPIGSGVGTHCSDLRASDFLPIGRAVSQRHVLHLLIHVRAHSPSAKPGVAATSNRW
ncbi:hypothetical protein LTR53_016738 [Teratosphaeriaceae sp. CCFEE 6253]|nr:hypothetical protein LTR53_016738 [Teratosphaeriaceae sp. CCFEE 6253]